MDWRQFEMDLEALNPDKVEAIFMQHGAQAVTLSDAGDEPVLEPRRGATPLWPQTRITGLFSLDADLQALTDDLQNAFGTTTLPPHRVTTLQDRAWEREWLRDFGPMPFGKRLWICPGDATIAQDDAIVVKLDPGLAFGTGTHPTTAMCLQWLDALALDDRLTGRSVLDYGCGSGVLAIAALKLGATHATAMDIDPQALTATTANSQKNAVADKISVVTDSALKTDVFDIVIANILAGPLIELAESISSHLKSGGALALSGVLAEQGDDVAAAYAPWIEFDPPCQCAQAGQKWLRLTGVKV